MSKEKEMNKVNECINDIFPQIMCENKIGDGCAYTLALVFKDCAINILFDEYSHGKTSHEREQKWDCVRRDLYRVIRSDHSVQKWVDNIISLAESDVCKKIINEQLHTQKWQYRDEFIQMALELFKDIKSEIRSLITLYIFRGNTIDLDVFFNS